MAGAPLPLAFETQGDGPPLLLLHGLFGSGTNWRGIARRLARHHRVWLVDARNHGRSPHAPAMSYTQMAADVRALMDAERVDRATVLGHSMGGKTAMTLALESPDRVTRLVVVDIAPGPSPGDHAPLIAAMRSLDLDTATRRSEADRLLAGSVPDDGLRAFLLQNLNAEDGRLRWRINLDAIEASMPSLLSFDHAAARRRYDGPTLFIRGERSDYLDEPRFTEARSMFPAARLSTVANSGHWVHAENPGGFLDALTGFLDHDRA